MEPLIRRQSSQNVGFSGYSGYAGRPVQGVYAHSVSGGAGGHGTKISTSTLTYGTRVGSGFGSGFDYQSSGAAADSLAIANEKIAMQHLNDRLASYLETVRSLEKANKSLEIKIRETIEKRGPLEGRDFGKYNAVIAELRSKVSRQIIHTHNETLCYCTDFTKHFTLCFQFPRLNKLTQFLKTEDQ